MEIDEVPDFFTESDQIDWENRVRIQAAIQKHIDHSISSTINLPKDTSPEIVGALYQLGWKLGLKGITVYVDGSRSGVLISEDDKDVFPQNTATVRPTELPCNIHHTTIQGEKWIILVGLLDNKPYEVMGGLSNLIEIPQKHTEGLLIKHPRKTMNSIYDLMVGDNGDANIQYAVEQMQKDRDSDMFSFAKCIARVLKSYIKDGTEATDKECPSCGAGDGLIYIEGCLTCKSCGYAKCG